jgi:hypothetical protein
MDFDAMAYPDRFIINGNEYDGKRDLRRSEVRIPYTNEPVIRIGDTFSQRGSQSEIFLKVIDLSFLKGGTLSVGTSHENMLTLKVENTTANEHIKAPLPASNYFGSIFTQQFQVGDHNNQTMNMTVKELTDRVSASSDDEAKSLLRKLLENPIVANIIGAGAAALLK